MKSQAGIAVVAIVALAGPMRLGAAPGEPAPSEGPLPKVEAISKPSRDVTMSFPRPGRIAKVLVKVGDRVKAGQELARQDDVAELIQLEQLKAEAEDEIRIQAGEAQLDQRKVDSAKMDEALRLGAATAQEAEHARLDVTIAELSLALAKFENAQAKRKYREAAAQLERMKLLSPFDGAVEELLAEEGEAPDLQEKVIRVVNTDPLWVDAPAPKDLARRLKRGDQATVEFYVQDAARMPASNGKVIHIASVADSASGTLTVRLEVPNGVGRPAGERVFVSFAPAPAAAAAAGAGKDPIIIIVNQKVAQRP